MPLRALDLARCCAALFLLWLAPLVAHPQAVTLAADAASAPYHTVVHFLASAAPTGNIVFADNGTPLLTLPAGARGTTVLATATLVPGQHSITAANAAGVSNAVLVTITPLPAPFLLTPDNTILFQHSLLNFALTGLPPLATGTLTYAQDGVPFATRNLDRNLANPSYQAIGDSITSGYTLADRTTRYADLFAAANGFTGYQNLSNAGTEACDLFPLLLLPAQTGPTQDISPLSSLMIGSSDMDNFGVPLGESNYSTCHRAALAWLAIPREFKVLPGDPAASVLSGPWQLPPTQLDSTYATLYNSSGSGAVSFAITSNGGPLYLWYLLGDHLAGAFTVTLDGTPTGTTYTTNPTNPIASRKIPDSVGIALLKLPVDPGPHTLRVDLVSGTVGLLAAATPPSPGATSVHPTVLAADVPNQNLAQAAASPAAILQYSADALDDEAGLQSDGLDIRSVPTHSFLGTSAAEFDDYAHPSILGHLHLATAFQTVFAASSTDPYLITAPSIPRQALAVESLGTHTFTATYSGDAFYQPSVSSAVVQVVLDYQSVTTLTAPATTFYTGQPITASAGIFPPNPGSTIALMEAGQTLATAGIAYNSASFSLPSLPPGLHTLYAAYAGDATDAASTSPPLTIRVLQIPSTLTLTSTPELPYATTLTLAAALQPAAATGTVLFSDSFTPTGQVNAQAVRSLGQVTLNSGVATLSLATLAPGTHSLTATYSGDTNYLATTSPTTLTLVDPLATTTLLTGAPAVFGQPSTFTASVIPASSTGTFLFSDSASATPVSIPVNNGTATWTTSTLAPGPHNISAAYSGDAIDTASTSPALSINIARAPSTLALTTPAPSLYTGQPVTLTAALTPSAGTGTVLFSDPVAGTLGQSTLASGLATLTLPSLPPGTYTISASYFGDAGTLPSTASTPVALQVLSRTTSTTLSAPATSSYSTPVTLSAAVSPTPTGGLVRFSDGAVLLGTTAVDHGSASFTTSALTAGPHTLTATFSGDTNLDGSAASATLGVTPATSTTALSVAQPSVLAGSPALFTVRIGTSAATAAPGGTVTLRSGPTTLATAQLANPAGGAAYATLSVPTPTTGTFPVTAFYSGDSNTSASDSAAIALSYTVAPRIASGTLTLSATQVPPMTPVTLTAAFTSAATSGPALVPTGSVTFSDGTSVLATVPVDSTGQATLTLPSAALGTYSLSAVYTPTGVFTASPVAPQTLLVTPPLAVAFNDSTLTMAPATTADATVTLTALSGYQGSVALVCTTPAPYLTCSVDPPASVSGTSTTTVHLQVARSTVAALHLPGTLRIPGGTATLTLALLLPVLTLGRRRHRLRPLLLLLASAMLATSLAGCGEGGNFGKVPTGPHLIQLTATAANTPTSTTLQVNIQ